ncbi:hypothetical protein ACJX0J_006110, partial [Zea mays]
ILKKAPHKKFTTLSLDLLKIEGWFIFALCFPSIFVLFSSLFYDVATVLVRVPSTSLSRRGTQDTPTMNALTIGTEKGSTCMNKKGKMMICDKDDIFNPHSDHTLATVCVVTFVILQLTMLKETQLNVSFLSIFAWTLAAEKDMWHYVAFFYICFKSKRLSDCLHRLLLPHT